MFTHVPCESQYMVKANIDNKVWSNGEWMYYVTIGGYQTDKQVILNSKMVLYWLVWTFIIYWDILHSMMSKDEHICSSNYLLVLEAYFSYLFVYLLPQTQLFSIVRQLHIKINSFVCNYFIVLISLQIETILILNN